MKRTLVFLVSFSLVISAVSCSTGKTRQSEARQSEVTAALSETIQLTNHMTEKERSKVRVGELTVFDHMQGQQESESVIPEEGVCIELWTEDDYIANWKKLYEEDPSILDGGSFEEAIEKSKPYFDEVYNLFVDGRCINFSELFPIIGYKGGELKIKEPPTVYCVIDENGNSYHVDKDNNVISEDEAAELCSSEHQLPYQSCLQQLQISDLQQRE